MKVRIVAESRLPTKWGEFQMIGFEEISTGKEHLALVHGVIDPDDDVLVRVHSECLTGDALFSRRCDCGAQLGAAMRNIVAAGQGVLIYHRQEGRNIGLLNKVRAYALQDAGCDTVEANLFLGFAADERDFTMCADILKLLNVKSVRLMTNNPEKAKVLLSHGVNVKNCIQILSGVNTENLVNDGLKVIHFSSPLTVQY